MTKEQVRSPSGRRIVEAARLLVEDGRIAEAEVRALRRTVAELEASGIAAVDYLADAIDDVLDDGILEQREIMDLWQAIARVLPADIRSDIFGVQTGAGMATIRQRAFLHELGEPSPPPGTTIEEASMMIDDVLARLPKRASNRQIMVLRFWGRLDLETQSRDAISAWMDAWYEADPDRRRAWTLFKNEVGDTGRQSDPSRVPMGIGSEYLAKVRASPWSHARKSEATAPVAPPAKPASELSVWMGLAALLVGATLWATC